MILAAIAKAKFVDVDAPSADWRLVHRQSDAMVPAVRSVFERAVRAVSLATPWDDVEERLASGNLEIERLIPWDSVGVDALMNPLTNLFQMTFARTGQLAARQLQPLIGKRATRLIFKQVGAVFEVGHPRASRWAGGNAAELVVEVTEQTKLGIRAAVVDGFEIGIPPRVLARDLKQIVGLNSRLARAVVKRRGDLIAAGLSAERVTRLVDRYAARLLRYRTQNIARTETIRASVEGQLEAWQQNRDARIISRQLVKEWIVTPDDRLCPICAPLANVQADVDGLFDTAVGRRRGPPAHPSCRCAIGLANPRAQIAPPAPRPPPRPRPRRVVSPARVRLPFTRPGPPVIGPAPPPAVPSGRAPRPARGRVVRGVPEKSPLRSGAKTSDVPLVGGDNINETRKVGLRTATGKTDTVIFKPEAGERFRGTRRSITNEKFRLARREDLAWKVDRALGTNNVPQTVWRNLDGEPGSLQRWVPNTTPQIAWQGRALTVEERYKMVVLDVAIGNTDRHRKNWMRITRGAKRGTAVAIDHGYSFPFGTPRDPGGFREFRSRPAAGVSLTEKMPEGMRRTLLKNLQETNWEDLMGGLDARERSAMRWRLKWLEQRLQRNDFDVVFRDYNGRLGGWRAGVPRE
ncbi:hypothetical protein LCGC14_0519140 [marine sediment metagenome]|uniref:Phage head morphogenesis domain-containing protein n=1 Tax=marine sediment metagenome TaxID=412755 RepID=A0A0F9V742_9ZZZZ